MAMLSLEKKKKVYFHAVILWCQHAKFLFPFSLCSLTDLWGHRIKNVKFPALQSYLMNKMAKIG